VDQRNPERGETRRESLGLNVRQGIDAEKVIVPPHQRRRRRRGGDENDPLLVRRPRRRLRHAGRHRPDDQRRARARQRSNRLGGPLGGELIVDHPQLDPPPGDPTRRVQRLDREHGPVATGAVVVAGIGLDGADETHDDRRSIPR